MAKLQKIIVPGNTIEEARIRRDALVSIEPKLRVEVQGEKVRVFTRTTAKQFVAVTFKSLKPKLSTAREACGENG